MDPLLASSTVIDWDDEEVSKLAARLRADSATPLDFVRRAFEWVRDRIRHTGDFQLDEVTCAASDALRHGTGYCYSKSHLLTALYRAQGIPAGLGYQRLSISGDGPPFCLHGFVVVHMEGHGWRRLDPRGNKPGITAEFSATNDSLAFFPTIAGEATFTEIHSEPLEVVVEALRRFPTRADFCNNLPDLSGSAAAS